MTNLKQKSGLLVAMTLMCVVMAFGAVSATEDLIPNFTRDGAFDFFCPSSWMVAGGDGGCRTVVWVSSHSAILRGTVY